MTDHPSHFASVSPDQLALVMADSQTSLTYATLEATANRIAHLMRARGLRKGDRITLFLENQIELLPICWAAQRSGLIFVAASTKLSTDELGYIIENSGSRLLFVAPSLADIARSVLPELGAIAVGGDIAGVDNLETLIASLPDTLIEDPSPGTDMLYSSGTTGRPKGILTDVPTGDFRDITHIAQTLKNNYQMGPSSVYLSPAPLYHAAPLRYCMTVQRLGGKVVVMEKFDPEKYLALIEKYRVTHTQLVPTMFIRLLKLPPEVRARYDLSSLRMAIHAAAPCPVEIKKQMIDWWGPIIYEYYSATEGAGSTFITPQEWLQKPGSVGRGQTAEVRIVDDGGQLLPPGEIGRVFFYGGIAFSYHNDAEKTRNSLTEHGATFGDIGYLDEDGYLFLTDRASFMIISGGVNIYPQEAENRLILHPKVADVAVFGVPHPEMGEEVKAVVQPHDWADVGPALEAELIDWCRATMSHVKCPRSVDFEPSLPRHDTGKLYKRLLRDRYWAEAAAKN